MYFLGSQEKCLDHEFKVLSLTQGFDIKSSKHVSLKNIVNRVV